MNWAFNSWRSRPKLSINQSINRSSPSVTSWLTKTIYDFEVIKMEPPLKAGRSGKSEIPSDSQISSLLNIDINDKNNQIIIAVFVGLVTLVLLYLLTRKKKHAKSIIFTGLCDSGKTLLFTQLVYEKYALTYTSLKENEGDYITTKKKQLHVVDIPGNERSRMEAFDKYKSSIRGLVYVVDSQTIQKDVKDVAEYLYTLLTDSVVQALAPPLLIACNKQDMTLAKSSKVVQKQLEKEITTVRQTRAVALGATSADGTADIAFLGKQHKDFEFAHLPQKVELVECSALGAQADGSAEPELSPITDWLDKMA